MTTFEIIQIVLGSGSFIGLIILIFRTGKFVQKFESFEKNFETLEISIKEINSKLDVHGNRLTAIETTLRLAEWFGYSHEKEKVGH